jgi:very-short-patch-repair endonuclease
MRFFRQYSIGPDILDFYCPTLKLAVELDGGQHNECENREYDDARSEYLRAQDIEVMRFWNHDILTNINSILSKLAERITPLCPPLI